MNNQFSQRVSDIITYSKEEANRLRNRYIGPEHLLLGMLRDGGGKAIEILLKLDIDLKRVKSRLEGFLKDAEDDTLLPDAEVPLSPMTAKILKMCMLEARLLKSATADTEHVLLAILKDGNNLAATVLEENNIDYNKGIELFGSMDMYNSMLSDWYKGINDKWNKIISYKNNNDMTNYAIEVHSLKSDAKYFGFTKLAELSLNHELKSKDNDIDYVNSNFSELELEYKRILNIVDNYLNK